MAAKFNKDTILKHRFWIIIGVALLMAFFGIFYLGVIVQADTTKLLGLMNLAGKYKPVANTLTVAEAAKHAQKAKDSEAGIWQKAYMAQAPLFRFAENVEKEFDFVKGLFALEIKMDKAPAEVKDWPADTEDTKSGTLKWLQPEFLVIVDSKGNEIKFQKTDAVDGNITVAGEDKKLNFPEIGNQGDEKKFLTIKYQVGKYFMDPLTRAEQAAFANSYKKEVLKILKTVDPYDDKGNGVVLLKDWPYRDELPDDVEGAVGGGREPGAVAMAQPGAAGASKMPFFRYVTKQWGRGAGGGFKPYSDEAWIAQENLWIQKEIYQIIRAANDSISIFKGDPVKKKGQIATYQNSYFTVELALDAKNNLAFKVKNRLPRGQKIDLLFRVEMNKGLQPELIKISGPMLKPAGTKGDVFDAEPIPEPGDSPRTGIYNVAQALSWETAAIKRIDYISIGSADSSELSLSHRTMGDLKPLVEKPAEVKPAGDAKDGMPGPGGGGFGNQNANANKTMLDHDLWTNRYTEVSEISRRIPVAIVMIVDQEQVDRILNAFNNSRLRFLQSQVLLNYYTGSLQPPPLSSQFDSLNGEKGNPFAPQIPQRGPGPGPGPGPMGGMGPGGMNGATPAAPELETNMELVIYGVMTIYQRHPPRSAAAAAKTQ